MAQWLACWAHNPKVRGSKPRSAIYVYRPRISSAKMDTLGIEPRASRMLSGCDTTTPRALWKDSIYFQSKEKDLNADGAKSRFFRIRNHTPQLTCPKSILHISGMESICFHMSPPFEKACKLSHFILGLNTPQLRLTGVWRNGSASDSRSEGWEFESLCPHFLCPHHAHELLARSCHASDVFFMTLWLNG